MPSRRDMLGAGLMAACGAAPARAAAGRLQVLGRRILYGGRPVMLHGVALGDPLLGRQSRPTADFATIAGGWNSNVVRLSVHPSSFRRKRRATLETLDRDVSAALANRLFVIIDWHVIGWPDGWFREPDADWGRPDDLYDSDMSLAEDFWAAVAQRHGGDGRIAFELWNEPVFHPDRPGDPAERWAALVPHWRRLLAAVRRHSGNLVLVSGDRWAYDLRGIRADRIGDANLAYAWHVYANHDDDQPSRWRRRLGGLHEVAPVLVTEWGFAAEPGAHYDGSARSFGAAFAAQMLEGLGLHDTAWCWHPDWGPAMLEDDWRTPTEFGRFVRDRLRRLPAPTRP